MRIFKSNLDNLQIGEDMFRVYYFDTNTDDSKYSLDFTSDLSNLRVGDGMFENVGTFVNFRRDEEGNPMKFDNLESANFMFSSSDGHKYFGNIDLPKLKEASGMFTNANAYYKYNTIENWTGNLDSLENGSCMFGGRSSYTTDGVKINTFNSNLPKLKYGCYMLPCVLQFRGTLPSLINGYNMFNEFHFHNDYKAQLDALSILCIVNSIPDRTGLTNTDGDGIKGNGKNDETIGGFIDIGCGCADTEEDKNAYAQEAGWDSFQEILDEFSAKNWDVRFTFNGRPTTTYNMRRTTTEDIVPIWAKLEEVIIPTEEELKNMKRRYKPSYEYISADGSKFFNIQWYHTSNGDNDGYTQFNSLQEAVEHYGLKEKEITE